MELQNKCVNTLRLLSVDMVQNANSGHPGMALGCAPIIHILFSKIMNFNFENKWFNRDRFIMSNGHGCALLYSVLHLCGYNINLNDLKNFRKVGSITPGHPEKNLTDGIEVTTGPLGQGFANGVGMAIASKHLASRFNRKDFPIINNKIFVLCGDGCLMEGITNEAASLAGHLCLNNLVVIYDNNGITIDGSTELSFTENTNQKFMSLGWNVYEIEDGNNDLVSIEKILNQSRNSDKPVFVSVKTNIGYGSDKENSEKSHGAPLGKESVKNLKAKFNFDPSKEFCIPDDVKKYYQICINNKKQINDIWEQLLQKYSKQHVNNYKVLTKIIDNNLKFNYGLLPNYSNSAEQISTRILSSKCLQFLAENIPQLIGGSADLTPSNNTFIDKSLQKNDYSGRYIHYGIREHSMCAIANGISTYNLLPYVGTFLIFTNYCLASIRLSALSKHHVIYVLTHDSVGLGEDGPTHQPIESLTILRSIPNLLTLRPADGNEVSGAYAVALEYTHMPTCICLSRQNLPQVKNTNIEGVFKGGYIVSDCSANIDLIIISTGSELHICVQVASLLKLQNKNVRVVSMPCIELFDKQKENYRDFVLPSNITKISIEAGSTLGWYKYANYCIGLDNFGMSGNGGEVMEYFGFTVEKIMKNICKKMGWN